MTVQTIPILPSADLDKSAAFYATLGFTAKERWPDYLVLAHYQGVEVHVTHRKRVRARTNTHAAYIRFDTAWEVEELYAAWATVVPAEPAAGAAQHLRPLVRTDYGMTEFAVVDLHGNLLRIGG